ncbi:hypothetical protein COU78_01200 [Candidatus Peregrinibacteria bacterium CG10_big_fil_rev_8_21_14_0_10_49_24]|nr:MAG: hypothetical protein COV83_04165 [Candidatus Peregrinibacteria bacterium CG11_big_fil_rev_8_21_14_0_20_49_14]PIR51343.1 MAG: hypothetical protein COU78_01200 [Candidatus Peregrinibacteria bacterium CG10_big_fil_rev_8_21_14_0_10_49_24]PJA68107.1 MAG: hypothetical protein CO157_01015 [Candidatus Peregrinibacteria bacterium CG_4_9_14_3_um_filter_49_12]
MFFPRKSSSKLGLLFGICISVTSFVGIHIGFIVLHEFVNEATPRNKISYAFDRRLEFVEKLTANVRGDSSKIETNTNHASERIEELEYMVSYESQSGTSMVALNPLLTDALYSMETSVRSLEKYTGADVHDLHAFTLALFVESSVDDISRRLLNIKEHAKESEKDRLTEAILSVENFVQRSVAITDIFDVEPSIATAIRTDFQNGIALRRVAQEKIYTQNTGSVCGVKNATCETSSDCCADLGLICSPVIISDGSHSKRCMVNTVLLCNIRCESGTWNTPRSCTMGVAPPDIPHCNDLEGDECKVGENSQHSLRVCYKS